MNKLHISQDIHLAVSQLDEDIIRSKGHELCFYLQEATDEITGNERISYHIGTAMYLYKDYINNDNIEYQFARLIAYVNLFEALSYQDRQSVIGAYRLHTLISDDRDFFYKRMMLFLGTSLDKILNTDSEEIEEKLNKMFYSVQYCLFMYCHQDPMAFGALSETEKKKFNILYNRFQKQYNVSSFDNDEIFNIGVDILRRIYKELSESHLQQYEFLGVLPK